MAAAAAHFSALKAARVHRLELHILLLAAYNRQHTALMIVSPANTLPLAPPLH